jgi:hypothetical protein
VFFAAVERASAPERQSSMIPNGIHFSMIPEFFQGCREIRDDKMIADVHDLSAVIVEQRRNAAVAFAVRPDLYQQVFKRNGI